MTKDNLIRIGKVSAVDYDKGLVAVVYADRDNSVTAQLPMLSSRYFMPEPGDQVLVLHLSNGAEAGVVIGRFYSDKNLPTETGAGLFRIDLNRDGTVYLRHKDGIVTIKGNTIIIDGDLSIIGNVSVTGDVSVAGDITATGDIIAGGISLKNHTHTGVHGETSPPH